MDLEEIRADVDKMDIKLNASVLNAYQLQPAKNRFNASMRFLFEAAGPLRTFEHS